MAGFAGEAPSENTASFEEAGLDISFTSWRQRYKTEGDGICRDTGTYGIGRYIEELKRSLRAFFHSGNERAAIGFCDGSLGKRCSR